MNSVAVHRLLVAGLLLARAATSTAATFTDHPLKYQLTNDFGHTITVVIPYVKTEDRGVANRINTALHRDLLDIDLPSDSDRKSKDPAVLPSKDYSWVSMSSRGLVVINKGRTVTVSVKWKSCSAYCTRRVDSYFFDTRTGRELNAADLVSPEGMLAMASKADAIYKKKLTQRIDQWRRRIDSTMSPREAARQYSRGDLGMYQWCFDERYSIAAPFKNLYRQSPGDMRVLDGGLMFSQGNCTIHPPEPIVFPYRFDYILKGESLRPYLTAYGKYLLLGDKEGALPAE
jgi:hypothetical protein